MCDGGLDLKFVVLILCALHVRYGLGGAAVCVCKMRACCVACGFSGNLFFFFSLLVRRNAGQARIISISVPTKQQADKLGNLLMLFYW